MSLPTTVKNWLSQASDELSATGIMSAKLDAELLLAAALDVDRTWLHAHGDDPLASQVLEQANTHIDRRLAREPLAYIVGYREFYDRKFDVTADTLIPRPESEAAIELLKKYRQSTHRNLIDVGTGSGCIGITAKLEFRDLDVTLSDISQRALLVASQNAKRLGADVKMIKSNLFEHCLDKFDIVVANLPYVDPSWLDLSPELQYEPPSALFADQSGLELINRLIDQAPNYLNSSGLLLLEADPTQHSQVEGRVKSRLPSLKNIIQVDYYLLIELQ